MKKNNLDEMREQKLLKIEHNACWLAFWGLFAAVMAQVLMGTGLTSIAGEFLLLLVLCCYIVAACLRQGIWDRRLTPDPRSNFLTSLGAGGFVWVICWLLLGRQGLEALPNLVISGILGLITFALCIAALTLCARAYNKKQAQLEQE